MKNKYSIFNNLSRFFGIQHLTFLLFALHLALSTQHCFSQNMYVAQTNGAVQSYFLNQQLKIVSSDSGCVVNIYDSNLQSYPVSDIKNITFLDVDCGIGINELKAPGVSANVLVYPNPFSDITNIELTVDYSASAIILIYNGQGILIKNLLNTKLNKGTYKYIWDGRSNAGIKLSAGMYFCQVTVADKTFTSKIFLIY